MDQHGAGGSGGQAYAFWVERDGSVEQRGRDERCGGGWAGAGRVVSGNI